MKHSGNFTEAKQVFYALNPQNVEMSVSASFICSSLFLSLSLSLSGLKVFVPELQIREEYEPISNLLEAFEVIA